MQAAQGQRMSPTALLVDDDRVSVSPNPPVGGRRATFKYRGLLAQKGAQQVFLHLGYGTDQWQGVEDLAMMPRPDRSWEATVEVKARRGPLSYCFRAVSYTQLPAHE
ncbi:MAG: hypothetical protein K6T75_10125, partial [Acetobacteraceae bacterium]|nr:hypothetical protein [Acetobacteraceae bacterium]